MPNCCGNPIITVDNIVNGKELNYSGRYGAALSNTLQESDGHQINNFAVQSIHSVNFVGTNPKRCRLVEIGKLLRKHII